METRKLIKFGNASHVISIPSYWTKRNKLSKGDLIYLDENGNNELILSPQKKEKKEEILKKEHIITDGKAWHTIQRELVSAYINNNKNIIIKGENLGRISEQIRDVVNNLVGLEIIEQTHHRIVTSDFVNIRKISIYNLIRRADIILRAMLSDAAKVPSNQLYQSIMNRDKDVNRLTILIYRVSKFFVENPESPRELTMTDYFKFWSMTENLERFGDELKRAARFIRKTNLPKNKLNELVGLFEEIEKFYIKVMGTFYKRDKDLLFKQSIKKDEIMKKVDGFLKKNYKYECVSLITEKYKNMINLTHSIVKTIIYN